MQGEQASRYFTVLRDEIITILQRMADLQYEEWLWLSDDMRVDNDADQHTELYARLRPEQQTRANFKQLLAIEAAGQNQYISDAGIYDLSRILQIMPEHSRKTVASKTDEGKALNKPSQQITVFISYSHNDEEHKDELITTLKGIKREYFQLEWWDDRQMISGEWEPQILEQLEQADIVVLLISRDFMASSYCFSVEMKKALVKYHQHGHVVIPVIIRHTQSWNNHDIGDLQALPKDAKPLDEWDNHDRFWGDVQRGLERELERLLVNRNGN